MKIGSWLKAAGAVMLFGSVGIATASSGGCANAGRGKSALRRRRRRSDNPLLQDVRRSAVRGYWRRGQHSGEQRQRCLGRDVGEGAECDADGHLRPGDWLHRHGSRGQQPRLHQHRDLLGNDWWRRVDLLPAAVGQQLRVGPDVLRVQGPDVRPSDRERVAELHVRSRRLLLHLGSFNNVGSSMRTCGPSLSCA